MSASCRWFAVPLVTVGFFCAFLGVLAVPRNCNADGDTGPYCNVGADPSLPKGCVGWCYSPKICDIHRIRLTCACR
jgi:hypothetical protein